VITLSFDPREGAELASRARRLALDRYDRPTATDGWHFLTGDAKNIRRLTDAVGFQAVWDDATGQFAHPAGIFVLTSDGMISRYLSGIEFRPRDLRLAVVEASEGRLGSVSDQLLMLCYQYDPTTGRYGFAIISALRASSLVTVALLLSAIVVMIRRDRRRGAANHRETGGTDSS
jgi:protein SCO1